MIDLLIAITMILMMLVVGKVIGVVKLKDKIRRLNESEITASNN